MTGSRGGAFSKMRSKEKTAREAAFSLAYFRIYAVLISVFMLCLLIRFLLPAVSPAVYDAQDPCYAECRESQYERQAGIYAVDQPGEQRSEDTAEGIHCLIESHDLVAVGSSGSFRGHSLQHGKP